MPQLRLDVRKVVSSAALILACCLLESCVSGRDVQWRYSSGFVKETLVLRRDGKAEYSTYSDDGGLTCAVRGRWSELPDFFSSGRTAIRVQLDPTSASAYQNKKAFDLKRARSLGYCPALKSHDQHWMRFGNELVKIVSPPLRRTSWRERV